MEQLDILRHVVTVLERLGTPYMLAGSYGSSIYGEPRFTFDIDIVIDMPIGQVSDFCASFPTNEYYVSESGLRDAISHRFQSTINHHSSGNKVDLIFPRDDDWGNSQLARRQRITMSGIETYVADAIDIVIAKMWYHSEGGSDKHLRDIVSMLKISPDIIDQEEVRRWADKLGYASIWGSLLQRLAERSEKE